MFDELSVGISLRLFKLRGGHGGSCGSKRSVDGNCLEISGKLGENFENFEKTSKKSEGTP
jgi:hypothetical protein